MNPLAKKIIEVVEKNPNHACPMGWGLITPGGKTGCIMHHVAAQIYNEQPFLKRTWDHLRHPSINLGHFSSYLDRYIDAIEDPVERSQARSISMTAQLLNDHGCNSFSEVLRELKRRYPREFSCGK